MDETANGRKKVQFFDMGSFSNFFNVRPSRKGSVTISMLT